MIIPQLIEFRCLKKKKSHRFYRKKVQFYPNYTQNTSIWVKLSSVLPKSHTKHTDLGKTGNNVVLLTVINQKEAAVFSFIFVIKIWSNKKKALPLPLKITEHR